MRPDGTPDADLQVADDARRHFSRLLAAALPLADDVSTPFTLYDPPRARQTLRQIRTASAAHGAEVQLALAVKACYLGDLLARLLGDVDMVGIQSRLERTLLPADAAFSFHSVHLDPELAKDAAHVVANSAQQWIRLVDLAPRDAMLGLRLAGPATGEQRLRFGVHDDDAAELIGSVSSDGRRVELHQHLRTRLTDVELAAGDAAHLGARANRIAARVGRRIDALNLGGGWNGAFELAAAGVDLSTLVTEQAGAALTASDEPRSLVLEPGRVVFEDAAVLVTSVLELIPSSETTYVVLDVGTGFLQPFGGTRFLALGGEPDRSSSTAPEHCTLVDGSCRPLGMIARQWLSPRPDVGERLALVNVGAYMYSFAGHFFALPPPAFALEESGEVSSLLDLDRIRAGWEAWASAREGSAAVDRDVAPA